MKPVIDIICCNKDYFDRIYKNALDIAKDTGQTVTIHHRNTTLSPDISHVAINDCWDETMKAKAYSKLFGEKEE
jgi:hypothetical protein